MPQLVKAYEGEHYVVWTERGPRCFRRYESAYSLACYISRVNDALLTFGEDGEGWTDLLPPEKMIDVEEDSDLCIVTE